MKSIKYYETTIENTLPSFILGFLFAGLTLLLYHLFGYDIKNDPDKGTLMVFTVVAFLLGVISGVFLRVSTK